MSIKDEQIDELQKSVEQTRGDLSALGEKLRSKDTELSERQDELNLVKMNLKTSTDKEQMYEQMIRLRDDKSEALIVRVKELESECGLLKAESEQYRQAAELLDKQIR